MFSARVIEVFLASPSDLPEEREAIRAALQDWNALNSESAGCVLLPRAWESHSTPDLAIRAQNTINYEVLRQADMVICCFWTRFGSTTGDYASGTAEEIERSIVDGKHVLLYFSDRPVVPGTVDPQQFADVMTFKASAFERGLCGSFTSPSDLRTQLANDLTRAVRRLMPVEQVGLFRSGATITAPNGRTFVETRDEVIQRAKRNLARWTVPIICRWESSGESALVSRRWFRDLESIWEALSDVIGGVASSLGYDAPLTRHLREELSWFRQELDGVLAPIREYNLLDSPPSDLSALSLAVADYIRRTRAIADLDWLVIAG